MQLNHLPSFDSLGKYVFKSFFFSWNGNIWTLFWKRDTWQNQLVQCHGEGTTTASERGASQKLGFASVASEMNRLVHRNRKDEMFSLLFSKERRISYQYIQRCVHNELLHSTLSHWTHMWVKPPHQCKVPDPTGISYGKAIKKANFVLRTVLRNKNGNTYILIVHSPSFIPQESPHKLNANAVTLAEGAFSVLCSLTKEGN